MAADHPLAGKMLLNIELTEYRDYATEVLRYDLRWMSYKVDASGRIPRLAAGGVACRQEISEALLCVMPSAEEAAAMIDQAVTDLFHKVLERYLRDLKTRALAKGRNPGEPKKEA